MGEIERRVAALELAFIEVGAWLEPTALEDARRSIECGTGGDADERATPLAAIQLIRDARQRFAFSASA